MDSQTLLISGTRMLNKANPIKRLNLVLIVSICLGEALIMFFLPFFGALSNVLAAALDVALLLLIMMPVVRWFVTEPMKKYHQDLDSAKHTILARENQMLAALNALASANDNDTGNHIIRTQQYVRLLAQRLKVMGHHPAILTNEHIERLFKVAPLHDLGKVGIPDAILKKMGKLTAEERVQINQHSMIGESILLAAQAEGSGSDLIATALKITGHHHERWDGSGYPRKLIGESIPIEARIMAVADVFDALVGSRPYKKAWTIEDAYIEIVSLSGTAFDPIVIDAFIAERHNFEAIANKH